MDTSILNPKTLFQKDVRYTIPTFQRPYVWTQERQWGPLWDDVRKVAEEYLEALGRADNDRLKAEQQTRPHFLGAIVLQLVPTPVQEIEQREIIDGQQRMITLQLLLDAIQEICEELDLRPTTTFLSKLVTNDKDLVGEQSHHFFKLWPTMTDRDAFRNTMDNTLSTDGIKGSSIVKAHEFFYEQVRDWIKDIEYPQSVRADALATAVTALLRVVVINLDYTENPNVIFETLNARGTPLLESDLIKNFVLYRSSEEGNGTVDIWEDMGELWWRKEVSQGRLRRPRLDMLFNHWLTMRTGSEVPPSRVFNAFRDYTVNQRVDDVMKDVKQDLRNYRRFEAGQRTPEEDRFYYRTSVMQMGVITPALLMLLSAEHEARIDAFHALESFLVRRMICRQTTKDYNSLTLDLTLRLQNTDLGNAGKIVAEFLRGQKADSREWPTDEKVTASLQSSPLYRLLTRGRLRLVLEGIEKQRRSEKAEQPDVPKNLTIEHLMPVSWGKHWPLPGDIDKEQAKQNRNGLIHTIGNLTLVTQKLNSTLSNASWETKRDALLKHSVMNMNSELMNESCWDEDSILCRSGEMAKLIAGHWPGPDSKQWE